MSNKAHTFYTSAEEHIRFNYSVDNGKALIKFESKTQFLTIIIALLTFLMAYIKCTSAMLSLISLRVHIRSNTSHIKLDQVGQQ